MLKVCRDNSFVSGGIQNLPRVISLEHIIERVRHPSPTSPVSATDAAESEAECCGADDIPCQLCDDGTRLPRRAAKSCLHCNASYCTICLRVCVTNGCNQSLKWHWMQGVHAVHAPPIIEIQHPHSSMTETLGGRKLMCSSLTSDFSL